MPTTTKTYTYNGSEIEDTSKGIRFTDGVLSPKNWEAVWTDQEKKDRGITWTTNTVYSGGSEAAEKLEEHLVELLKPTLNCKDNHDKEHNECFEDIRKLRKKQDSIALKNKVILKV